MEKTDLSKCPNQDKQTCCVPRCTDHLYLTEDTQSAIISSPRHITNKSSTNGIMNIGDYHCYMETEMYTLSLETGTHLHFLEDYRHCCEGTLPLLIHVSITFNTSHLLTEDS